MAFDLYFAGGVKAECVIKYNGNKLYSQLNERDMADKFLDSVDEGRYTGKLLVDSGAYSAHTVGRHIDVDEYIEYLNYNEDYLTGYVQVDEIPGRFGVPKTRQQLIDAPENTWKNYVYMRERLDNPNKLLALFHMGEDFSHLVRMLETTFENGEHIPYIGISPANDMAKRHKDKWFEQCFRIIRDSKNPNVKTHAFGMTSVDLLEKYPFYSADSTNCILSAGMGNILVPNNDNRFTTVHIAGDRVARDRKSVV